MPPNTLNYCKNSVDELSNNSKSLQNNACIGIQERSGREQQSGGIFLFSKICSKMHTFREVIVLWGGKVHDRMKLRER